MSAFYIVFLPSARKDVRAAADWYEKQQFGLGTRFKQNVAAAVDRLLVPEIEYGPALLSLSRIFVKQFPYIIYFSKDVKRSRIVVFAVLHGKQNKENILEGRI